METEVVERVKKEVRLPKKWAIIFHNDDVTPAQFVVELLITVYYYDDDAAIAKTNEIDAGTHAVVGVFSKEIAHQKYTDTQKILNHFKYPFKVTLEEES